MLTTFLVYVHSSSLVTSYLYLTNKCKMHIKIFLNKKKRKRKKKILKLCISLLSRDKLRKFKARTEKWQTQIDFPYFLTLLQRVRVVSFH